MIRPDAKLDLHFLKNNIISRATAGNLVQAAETTYGNGRPLVVQTKNIFTDPSLYVDYDPDPSKAHAKRIPYGVFVKWELFNYVVAYDHTSDVGLGEGG